MQFELGLLAQLKPPNASTLVSHANATQQPVLLEDRQSPISGSRSGAASLQWPVRGFIFGRSLTGSVASHSHGTSPGAKRNSG